MKTILRICVIIFAIAMAAALLYFFLSGTLPLVALSLSMLALSGIMACEQIRGEKEDGQPRSKPYFYLFICGMIFYLAVTIILIVSGNFTFTI